ncbi:MAG: threonine/serine exporter ThrE family protein [Bacteroidales bacterium]
MNNNTIDIQTLGDFLKEYASHMIASGVHTSRVVRIVRRVGESYGYDVKIIILSKSLTLSIRDEQSKSSYMDLDIIVHKPINFEHNSRLSALSWTCYDDKLPFEELKRRYEDIISKPRMKPFHVLLLASAANASFCKLFGGDWLSVFIVFFATALAFFVRQQLNKTKINTYLTIAITAFVASFGASAATLFDTTSDIALATSVLFLVPGVPLINGIIDIVESHTLAGVARLIQATLWIICFSAGLSITLLIVKSSLL